MCVSDVDVSVCECEYVSLKEPGKLLHNKEPVLILDLTH